MNRLFTNSYFLSIFLALLPSIYLVIPGLNTLNAAKLIWILLFTVLMLNTLKQKNKFKIKKTLLLLFLFFFLTQSLSVINAQNITAFINSYKDFLPLSFFFIISLFYVKTKSDIKKIFYILLVSSLINILLQLFIFLDSNLFINIGSQIIHPAYFDAISANIARGRIFLTTYDEILIPLIFYFFLRYSKKPHHTLLSLIILVLIIIFASLSGFRTKILMAVFAITSSMIFFLKKTSRKGLLLIFIFFTFYVLYSISPSLNIQTGIDRLIPSESTTKELTTGRTTYWKNAYEMGLSSPVIGIGLGNYYDYLDSTLKTGFSFNKNQAIEHKIALQDPHNIFVRIFAETGGLGLISFILLLAYFFQNDILMLKTGNKISQSFILSFWTLFIFSMLNPSSSLAYQTLFWLFRGLLSNSRK